MFRVYCCVVLVSFIALSQGHKAGFGSCPQYTGLTGFDVNRFLGDWYVIQQSKPDDPCMKYSINFVKQGKLRVFETAYKNPNEVKFAHRKKLKYEGASTSEMILHSHSSFEATSKFTVLMTDYNSFAAVYICQGLLAGHRESIEIWSRAPTLNTATIQQLQAALISKGMDLTGVDVVDQTSCRGVSG